MEHPDAQGFTGGLGAVTLNGWDSGRLLIGDNALRLAHLLVFPIDPIPVHPPAHGHHDMLADLADPM